ncbi:MAG: hypothetical protein GY725_26295 [bacterium]|nr:hypothetical protein [bacterium]
MAEGDSGQPGEEVEGEWAPPPHQMATWAVISGAVLLAFVLFSVQTDFDPDTPRPSASRTLPPEPEPVLLAAPEIADDYLPCSDCHESSDLPERDVRELEDEHDELDFAHGNLWCYSCHNPNPRDRQKLRLADDTNIPFEDSWKLCTQCHAKKLPDWRAGVHGKRTGHWWGPKEYRTCVVCHDPHNPPFKPIEPKRPPRRPEAIAGKEPHDEAS